MQKFFLVTSTTNAVANIEMLKYVGKNVLQRDWDKLLGVIDANKPTFLISQHFKSAVLDLQH